MHVSQDFNKASGPNNCQVMRTAHETRPHLRRIIWGDYTLVVKLYIAFTSEILNRPYVNRKGSKAIISL